MLVLIKKILGKSLVKFIRPSFHGIKSFLSAVYFGFPSYGLIVIGITGTKGKTSTTVTTGRLLNLLNIKTGYLSTAAICLDGKNEFLNPHKNTTLDGFFLQQFLSKIKASGCKVVVLEMSSIGLDQNRHWGIGKFDITAILNMFPEHIEYHSNWQNYMLAKAKLFKNLKKTGVFICTDEENQKEVKEFMWQKAPASSRKILLKKDLDYSILESKNLEKKLKWQDKIYQTNFTTDFEIANLVYSLTIANQFVSDLEKKLELNEVILSLNTVPGRMETAVKEEKWGKNIQILVDYAHEPESMKQLLETLKDRKNKGIYDLIIHIVSCDGAGRDDWKKPVMGKLSYDLADISIVTTDNYDSEDNPEEILDLLTDKFDKKRQQQKYFRFINRETAFRKSLEIAKDSRFKNILIVSTGVGSEQALTQPSGSIKWDEGEMWKKIWSEN
jgi:UDP-N-acetylmuramoyl-L-alanyl-D-glutamate--2,6-diaminopimelate ligase